jgi:hypothetical protein
MTQSGIIGFALAGAACVRAPLIRTVPPITCAVPLICNDALAAYRKPTLQLRDALAPFRRDVLAAYRGGNPQPQTEVPRLGAAIPTAYISTKDL